MKKKITHAAIIILMATVSGCSEKKEAPSGAGNKRVAQKINCVNNLKMIGIAFRVWAGDHQGHYPCNTSTNDGGTMESSPSGPGDFDTNAILYLRNMRGEDELTTPLLLVCPQDTSWQAVRDWDKLQAENITYRFRAGYKISPANPHEILAVCPIDGNTLYCDGTVLDKNGKVPEIERAQ